MGPQLVRGAPEILEFEPLEKSGPNAAFDSQLVGLGLVLNPWPFSSPPNEPRRPEPRRHQESPGEPRKAQEIPKEPPRRAQENPGEPRRAQESPGEPRRAQESSGETGRTQAVHWFLQVAVRMEPHVQWRISQLATKNASVVKNLQY